MIDFGQPVDDVLEAMRWADRAKWDMLLPGSCLEVAPFGGGPWYSLALVAKTDERAKFIRRPTLEIGVDAHAYAPLNPGRIVALSFLDDDVAFSSICTRAGVPVGLGRRLIAGDAFGLFAELINFGLTRHPTPVLLRAAYDPSSPRDICRAVLSHEYQPVDDVEVAELLVRAATTLQDDSGSVMCMSREALRAEYRTTGAISVFRLLSPYAILEQAVGDDIAGGFTVQNSEVGKSAVRIGSFNVVLACTNGMVRFEGDGYDAFVHKGGDSHTNGRFAEWTGRSLDTAIRNITEIAGRFRDSASFVPASHEGVRDWLVEQHISLERAAGIIGRTIGKGWNIQSLSNALSFEAHSMELDLEAQVELQEMATRVLYEGPHCLAPGCHALGDIIPRRGKDNHA